VSFYEQGLSVGAESPSPSPPKKRDGVLTFIILGVLGAIVFGLSPGARHFYRHGKLPPG
jgi:hypothetical protein